MAFLSVRDPIHGPGRIIKLDFTQKIQQLKADEAVRLVLGYGRDL